MGLHLKEGDDDLAENHEINVTPFIDVMLVLLIIFMVAAPLATVDIKVDLPASSAKPAPRPEKPVFLSVKADQRLFLGEEPVKRLKPWARPWMPGPTTTKTRRSSSRPTRAWTTAT
jgi:biopolymer transport protein ExbD